MTDTPDAPVDNAKPELDSNNFTAIAHGIFQNASNPIDARNALVDGYNSYDWSDPVKASQTLEQYGKFVKQKFNDQTPIAGDIGESAPIKLSTWANVNANAPAENQVSNADIYDHWRNQNIALLNDPKHMADMPGLVVQKQDMIDAINAQAEQGIRLSNTEKAKEVLGGLGATEADKAIRATEVLTKNTVGYPIKWATGYDLPNFLAEYTDPSQDNDFASKLAEGTAAVGSFAMNPSNALQGVQALAVGTGAVIDRGQKTYRATGDKYQTAEAVGAEAAAQTAMLAGGRLLYGANVEGQGLPFIAGRTAAESAAMGGSQALSNVAENLQQQKPAFKDISRGVGTQAAVGGFLGGLGGAEISAKTDAEARATTEAENGGQVPPAGRAWQAPIYDSDYSKPFTVTMAKNDNTVRASEIQEHGAPVTPVTKQVIGPLVAPLDNEDTIPGDEGVIHSYDPIDDPSYTKVGQTDVTVNGKTETTYTYVKDPELATQPARPIPTKAFTTTDGSTWNEGPQGQGTKEGEQSHDQTHYINEETKNNLQSSAGQHLVRLDENKNPVIDIKQPDGSVITAPIPHVDEPTVDHYPLPISEIRTPNNDEIHHLVRIPRDGDKITSVEEIDKSIGAQQSQEAVNPDDLNAYYRDLLNKGQISAHPAGEASAGLTPKISDAELKGRVGTALEGQTLEDAHNELQNPNTDIVQKNILSTAIRRDIAARQKSSIDEYNKAIEIGDKEGVQAAIEKSIQADLDRVKYGPSIGESGVEISAAMRARKGGDAFDSDANQQAYEKTYTAEVAKTALEEGVSPKEIAEAPVKSAAIDEETKNVEKVLDEHLNTPSDEENALDTVIKAIEVPAEQKVKAKSAKIDAEKEQIKKDIETVSGKPEKTAKEESLIDAAKKRLAKLDEAKAALTPESQMTDSQKQKLATYKEQKDNATRTRQEGVSPEVKAAREKLAQLAKEKIQAERLLKKQQAAQQKGMQAKIKNLLLQNQKSKLDLLLEGDITPSTKALLENKKAAIEGATSNDPKLWEVARNVMFKNWIATGYGAVRATKATLLTQGSQLAAALMRDSGNIVNGVFTGNYPERYQALEGLRGLLNKDTFEHAKEASKLIWNGGAFTQIGDRYETPLSRDDITVLGDKQNKVAADHLSSTKQIQDYLSKQPYSAATPRAAAVSLLKAVNTTGTPLVKALSISEAVGYFMGHNMFDRMGAAAELNKASAMDVSDAELQKYKYNPQDNWAKAEAVEKQKTKDLAEVGIDRTRQQEFYATRQRYEMMPPKEIAFSSIKQAGQIVTTLPAPGFEGMVSDLIKTAARPGGYLNPLKYLVPFTNPTANILHSWIGFTPFGWVDTVGPLRTDAKYTDFEVSVRRSTSLLGSILTATAYAYMREQKEKNPGAILPIDAIGKYANKASDRAPYTNTGGQLNSWVIGGKNGITIPFEASGALFGPMGVILGSMMDDVRSQKEPDPTSSMLSMHAVMTLLSSPLKLPDNISMLQGLTSFVHAIKGENEQGNPIPPGDQGIALAKILKNTTLGVALPAQSVFKTLSRLVDNPVEAKHDFKSAMFEGIPGLQSAFGQPALNALGGPMPSGWSEATEGILGLHRVLSIGRSTDIDLRWAADNNYGLPNISNFRFSKSEQKFVADERAAGEDSKELDYMTKHQIFAASESDLREVVGRYRERLGNSAFDPHEQERLDKDFTAVLRRHADQIIKSNP